MYPAFHQVQLSIYLLFYFYKILLLISRSISRPITRQSRFSEFNLIGNNKPPFAHSPNNPIHPDHNGITVNIPNDIRSQMHQRVCV
jgi:hypothetical protein